MPLGQGDSRQFRPSRSEDEVIGHYGGIRWLPDRVNGITLFLVDDHGPEVTTAL